MAEWTETERRTLARLLDSVRGVDGEVLLLGADDGALVRLVAETCPTRPVAVFEPTLTAGQVIDSLAHVHPLSDLDKVRRGQWALVVVRAELFNPARLPRLYDRVTDHMVPGSLLLWTGYGYTLERVDTARMVNRLGLDLLRQGQIAWAYPRGVQRHTHSVSWPLPALYLSRAAREDRRAGLLESTAALQDLLQSPEWVEGHRPLPVAVPVEFEPRSEEGQRCGAYGCLQGHRAMIERARDEGWPAVVLMEDDCRWVPAAAELLPRVLQEVPASADLVYLGCPHRGMVATRYSRHLRGPSEFMCTHAYVLFTRAYDRILAEMEGARDAYDVMLREMRGLEAYGSVPWLATQGGGVSDIMTRTTVRSSPADAEGPMMLHLLGHPTHPLDLTQHPEDAQLQVMRNVCYMLEQARQSYLYYGMRGSQLPRLDGLDPVGRVVDLGQAQGPWIYGNDWHKIYTDRLATAMDQEVEACTRSGQLACSLYGWAHGDVASHARPLIVELAAGYPSVWSPYKVFPSYTWQAEVYATWDKAARWKWFDTVLPHPIAPDDYARPTGLEPGEDYALFIGRPIRDKGLHLAHMACGGMLPLHVHHKGLVLADKVREMYGAVAVLAPSEYQEPFGLVAVEAQMCGTPVVTTDWGAFAETVEHGRTGFRCRTTAEFREALLRCAALDRDYIRARARRLYSPEALWPAYERYCRFVLAIWRDGYTAEDARRW